MVLCLEDSIADADVPGAEANLVAQFADLAARAEAGEAEPPLLFIRVRDPEQIPDLVRRLGPAVRLLSGFVLPKFTEERGVPYLEALATAEARSGHRLFAMPVLESPSCSTSRPAPPRSPGSPAPSTSTATGSWPCGWASPTSAPPTGCAARPT